MIERFMIERYMELIKKFGANYMKNMRFKFFYSIAFVHVK